MAIRKRLLCVFFALQMFRFFSFGSQTFYITETFKNSLAPSFTFGGYPNAAYLTAGVNDPLQNGWLRLTKDTTNQTGYAIVNQSFPSSYGVQVDLEFKIWRINDKGIGADGFSVFLFDAATNPFSIGGFGGSLGYAQIDNYTKSSGVSGGYVGIGIDEFGNYSKEFEGRIGGAGFHSNSVGVRGPAPKYEWLTGNFDLGFLLEYGKTTQRPSDSVYYRRVQIEIIPMTGTGSAHYKIKVRIKTEKNKRFYDVLSYEIPEVPPAMLKLGFAASTGDCYNFHEIRNLQITTPGGVRVEKTVDKTVANVGDELTYKVNVYNQSDSQASSLMLKDLIDQSSSRFQITSVKFDDNDYSGNKATGYSDSEFSNVSLTMEPSSQATFTVKGKIKGYPANGKIRNTAIFNVGSSGIVDYDQTNDTSTVITSVNDLGLCAIDDSARAVPGSPVNIRILDNDLASVSPIDPSSVEIVANPQHGTVFANTDGTVDYTAMDGYFGEDVFTYRVKDETGAWSNIANVLITLRPKEFFIPNVITPNGDHINDCFVIPGLADYPKSRLKILNRWGNEVYFNSDYQNDWDGQGLNEGTYFYSLVVLSNGKEIVYKGWVLLKR